jgi:hypothetical protein
MVGLPPYDVPVIELIENLLAKAFWIFEGCFPSESPSLNLFNKAFPIFLDKVILILLPSLEGCWSTEVIEPF